MWPFVSSVERRFSAAMTQQWSGKLITEAHEGKWDFAGLCLDLANAYGSIPHMLVERTLEWSHVPSNIKDLVTDYYDNFNL